MPLYNPYPVIGLIGGTVISLMLWALILWAVWPSPAQDFTDTGVGCLDECLEPMDTNDDKEPIRWDHE